MSLSNLLKSLLFITVLTFVATGCGNRGPSIIKTKYCEASYDPMTVANNRDYAQKIELKPGEEIPLDAKQYTYDNSQIYYNDTDKDIRIHITHAKNSKGEYKTSLICAGGKGINRKTVLTFTIPVVSDLKVNTDKSTQIKRKTYTANLEFIPNKPALTANVDNVDSDFINGTPLDTYLDFTESKQTFASLKNDSAGFQLVAHLKSTQFDQKSGKDVNTLVRTLVTLRTDTPKK